MEIPQAIELEFTRLQKLYNWSWIGYDASRDEHFVSIIPFGWLKQPSMFITKLK